MEILIDSRPTKIVFTDRENHQYAEDKQVTKLICSEHSSIVQLVCHLLFDSKELYPKEYNFIVILYGICVTNRKNELDKVSTLKFISEKIGISYRSLDRYIKKFITYGIITETNGRISFTKYYNPVNIKFPNTDFIVIEVNPNKTSREIKL